MSAHRLEAEQEKKSGPVGLKCGNFLQFLADKSMCVSVRVLQRAQVIGHHVFALRARSTQPQTTT